jgi:BolA protein
MVVQDEIEARLSDSLSPLELEVRNESFMHNVPANSETHFKVTAVSSEFNGLRKVRRHQLVYGFLSDLIAGPVHALALHLYTPDEWQDSGGVPDSPNCHGGEK